MNPSRYNKEWKQITDDFGRPSLFVPVAFGEDYDRCFGNTGEAMRVTLNTLDDIVGIPSDMVRQEQLRVEAGHKPFNTVETIVHFLDQSGSALTWERDVKPAILLRSERQHHQDRLLTLGSRAVISSALQNGFYPLVITYGAIQDPKGERQKWTAKEWQTTKVIMTPVLREHPLVVSEVRSKGKLIKTWETTLHGESVFLLPQSAWLLPQTPVYAKEILMVDDSKGTFADFSGNMYGIHVLPENDDDIRVSQVNGEYPADSRVILERGMARVAGHLDQMSGTMPSRYFANIDK
jgi:hypothetical protein